LQAPAFCQRFGAEADLLVIFLTKTQIYADENNALMILIIGGNDWNHR